MKAYPLIAAVALAAAPTTAQAITLADHLKQSGSHALVTIDLKFSTLANLSKSLIEPEYNGSKDVGIGKLSWKVKPGRPNFVADNGSMVVSATTIANMRFGNFLISVSQQFRANAQVSLKPQLKEDWSMALNASGRAVLSDAKIRGISIRSKLQGDLDRAFKKALANLNAKTAAPKLIKGQAAEFWQKFCEMGRGKGQLGFVPKSAAMSQPKVYAGGIRMTLVVSGDVTTTAALTARCPTLPETLSLLD